MIIPKRLENVKITLVTIKLFRNTAVDFHSLALLQWIIHDKQMFPPENILAKTHVRREIVCRLVGAENMFSGTGRVRSSF
jgi:hypothetical protein